MPILRAVILAPSGVILHLSGNRLAGQGNDVAAMTTDASTGTKTFGNKGGMTGSINLRNSRFVMIMNGYKGEGGAIDEDNNPYITASLDPTDPSYIKAVLNTDPLKIEEKGHLLLSAFDINAGMGAITGSGVVTEGHKSTGVLAADLYEDVVFLLTSSIGRGANSSTIPDYEDFTDRYSNASSPFIISQKFGGRAYDLFKLVRLDDGEIDNRYFIQVENIDYKTDSTKYGSFDLVIRDIFSEVVQKTYSGLTFDPSSENYIARAIGDQYTYFDFDNSVDSQKIIVEGSFANKDNFFRVKLSDDLVAGNVPKNAVPLGFRGPGHLVTSGSLLSSEAATIYSTTDLINRVSQPPFPYKKNINNYRNSDNEVDSSRYWGVEINVPVDPNYLNATAKYQDTDGFPVKDRTIEAWSRWYPSHRTDRPNMFAKNLPGDASSTVTSLDTDAFNYNLFSLENILVRTGSDDDATITTADTTKWVTASYTRSGIIATNVTNKTRAFEPRDLTNSTNRDYAKFTIPILNGFNGHNIYNAEKSKMSYRATKMEIDDQSSQGGLNGPTVAAYRRAIDIMGSKTDADIQVLAIPGQRHPTITDYAITAVENRFDSLLVMDIEERDKYNLVASSSAQKTVTAGGDGGVSITYTVNDFKNRSLDSSFAAAYFPDVTIVVGGEEKSR